MAANVETTSHLERRVNIALPSAQIDGEVEDRLKRLARTFKMKGFRPGKVPLKVVAQQYADQVRREVVSDALQKGFAQAVREQNLKVAGYPRFEPVAPAENAPSVEFSATFEIYPDVAVGDIAQTTIERPVTAVGDAEIERTLEIMRKQRATYTPVSRAAQVGDRVTIDYAGTMDGQEFEGGKGEDVSVLLGEGRLLKDFEAQVVDMKTGEGKAFELRFPEDYHSKELAGKTATFDIKLKQVEEARLPAIDAEFAKSLGVADGNLDTMRKDVEANLQREVKRRVGTRLKDQIMQALVDASRLEVPKSLVELEIERMTAAARKDLEGRGIKTEGMPIPRDMFEQQAQRRVALGLILAEVVKSHGLQAKPEQVRALVEEQAQSYEEPSQVVKWYYQSPERLRDVESMVLEENVVEWAMRTGKVVDKDVAFDELMGNSK